MKKLYRKHLAFQAGLIASYMVGIQNAHANNFSSIAENIVESIEALPGLLSGIAYLFGILLGVLGILKIKDHVENPGQTHLKDGAVRLASGGALFALPMVYEAMSNTIGSTGIGIGAAELNPVTFGLNP
jgi:hypothetical protein